MNSYSDHGTTPAGSSLLAMGQDHAEHQQNGTKPMKDELDALFEDDEEDDDENRPLLVGGAGEMNYNYPEHHVDDEVEDQDHLSLNAQDKDFDMEMEPQGVLDEVEENDEREKIDVGPQQEQPAEVFSSSKESEVEEGGPLRGRRGGGADTASAAAGRSSSPLTKRRKKMTGRDQEVGEDDDQQTFDLVAATQEQEVDKTVVDTSKEREDLQQALVEADVEPAEPPHNHFEDQDLANEEIKMLQDSKLKQQSRFLPLQKVLAEEKEWFERKRRLQEENECKQDEQQDILLRISIFDRRAESKVDEHIGNKAGGGTGGSSSTTCPVEPIGKVLEKCVLVCDVLGSTLLSDFSLFLLDQLHRMTPQSGVISTFPSGVECILACQDTLYVAPFPQFRGFEVVSRRINTRRSGQHEEEEKAEGGDTCARWTTNSSCGEFVDRVDEWLDLKFGKKKMNKEEMLAIADLVEDDLAKDDEEEIMPCEDMNQKQVEEPEKWNTSTTANINEHSCVEEMETSDNKSTASTAKQKKTLNPRSGPPTSPREEDAKIVKKPQSAFRFRDLWSTTSVSSSSSSSTRSSSSSEENQDYTKMSTMNPLLEIGSLNTLLFGSNTEKYPHNVVVENVTWFKPDSLHHPNEHEDPQKVFDLGSRVHDGSFSSGLSYPRVVAKTRVFVQRCDACTSATADLVVRNLKYSNKMYAYNRICNNCLDKLTGGKDHPLGGKNLKAYPLNQMP
ncbi:unnamed protein product [Amoebophrya sp. A120]|nr:unnamed protein product [Amoebophrya sp. A120]|eukprot:GSA120T00000058001.1